MLLSRVADALYWISRYLERAEHTARLDRRRLDLGLDRASPIDGLGDRAPVRRASGSTAGRRRRQLARWSSALFDLVEPQLGRRAA